MSRLKIAKLEAEAASLRDQLRKEKTAHEKTLLSLERSRSSKIAKPRAGKSRPRSKKDIVRVIAGDIHGNKHDPAAMAAFLSDLKHIQPDEVFLGGDILDCGGFLAAHHPLGYVAETEDSYEDDILATNKILDSIQDCSGNAAIEYLQGNHEHRVERWALTQKARHNKDFKFLMRQAGAENVLHLKERGIRYYGQGDTHEGCYVPGWVKKGKLFFVHKLSNARNAASQALGMAGASVVYFDSHRGDYFPSDLPGTGTIAAWNPGCLCKKQPLYAHTRPTRWTHGYLVQHITPSGNFAMFPVLINRGVSYASSMLTKPTT